ncbi:MAG: copper resistance protein B [Pseudomonadota bacterium]|nr:copper resistance protein B [Pseudomonadota bacterium]
MSHDAMPTMDMPQSSGTSTHASEPALERPALSQHYQPPHMPGMDMDDMSNQHFIYIENLEGVRGNRNGGTWDAQGWYGGDFDKFWFKSEGQRVGDRTTDSKVEALWAHAAVPFWDTQVGVRYDFSGGPSRQWLAFGVQGVSPYWFDIEATGYVSDAGRTAARLKAEYDLYLTQRFILRPEMELNVYGKADPQREISAGLSDALLQLRLRYEFTRGFAPYIGFVWARKLGSSAAYAQSKGKSAIDHRLVTGLEFFF